MRKLLFIIVVLFLFGCDGSNQTEPEFKIEGCGEEQNTQIEDAVSQVVTVGLEQMTKGSSLTPAQKTILQRICGLEVSITIKCKECDKEDPNPCAYSQPDLPLLQSEERITVKKFLNELQRKGGITVTLCRNEDGTVPSDSCANAIHASRDLRSILLHELNHFVINDYTHNSTTWTDVEEVNWENDE